MERRAALIDEREMEATLELRGVSKFFGARSAGDGGAGHWAVDNVSLTIPAGSFFSLLGPSGCGKTTTLRLIGGFETPSAGEIWLNGARIDSLPPHRRPVNTVFQSYALFPHLNVRGNIEFGLRGKGRKSSESEAALARVIAQLQLAGKESRNPNELSGGERQRVALARALVLSPDVLLLDEPLAALDPQLRKQVRAELKDLQRRTGVTFLFVTHDQEEALALSDCMALMNGGRVEQTGPPRELYLRPKTRFAASFLGAMNWIGDVGIRPEATRIGLERPADVSVNASNVRRVTISHAAFLGPVTHLECRTEAGEAVIAPLAPGCEAAYSDCREAFLWWSAEDELRFP